MLVKELIQRLSNCDPEKQVDSVINFDDNRKAWVGMVMAVEDDQLLSAVILHVLACQLSV